MEDKNIQSVLKLDKLVFDKIEFKRLGFKNDNEFELEIKSNIMQRKGTEIYKVTLMLNGNKPDEYFVEISLTGYFSFNDNGDLASETKNSLIRKNSVAIMMPYLRSELSLLTAQPDTECVILPAFNINNMLHNDNNKDV